MNRPVHNAILTEALSHSIREGEHGLSSVPGLLKRIIQEDAWRERLIQQTGELVCHERFEDFVTTQPLEGIGADLKTLERLCAGDREALDLLDQATQRAPGRPSETVDIINGSLDERPTGTARQCALRKLRKDRPDLHGRVIAGEVSPHAAMVEAGFRKKTLTIPGDVEGAARILRRHFNVAELIAALTAEGPA